MRSLITAAFLALCGCASHALIPTEQRGALERDLTGKNRDKYLRLSYYVTPFFGDASKRLLTPVPPGEVRLLNHPNGDPVNPGKVEKILPAGTRARITKVEFPTAWVIAERVVYTPRTQPWVYLEVEGHPQEVPLVLVLRPHIKDEQEFLAELERYLAHEDLAPLLAGWTEAVREAIRGKSATLDMPAEALEMAWGYPERKRIRFEESVKNEEWAYPGGKRTAYLTEGRVVRLAGEEN
ncbi:MAG: hypothetical protein ACOZIN_20825 [Myxococcota bacterium]